MLKSAQEHFYYFYHSEGSKVRKSLDCLVTNSLRMEIVLFVIGRIYSNQFKCNHFKNKIPFQNFLLRFRNLHQILNILKKS